ncbi:MAG: cytochrome c3 family protein [Dehalococcoidia bacterium]
MRPSANMLPLAVVGLVVTGIVGFIVVVLFISWFSHPPFGLGNAPPQPIAFPHDRHAGEDGIQCEFCHRNVTKGAAATVPAVEQCLFCHKQINPTNLVGTTTVNLEEIQRVVDKFSDNNPIDWERVHRLPDHVRFVHEAHIRFLTQGSGSVNLPIGDTGATQLLLPVGEACSVCHGDVAGMKVVQPQSGQSLKMGTCVDCHRQANAPTDCTICHK